MTRKGKQPGGHNPLTYHERSKLGSSGYGTATARLGSDGQNQFGDCCLGLAPAVDPVATPSGHIYSREAIVSYLLTKTQQLKEEKIKYDAKRKARQELETRKEREQQERSIDQFAQKDFGASHISTEGHASAYQNNLKRKIDIESSVEKKKDLKRTSYWLSDFQPKVEDSEVNNTDDGPPDRPPSPMTKQPLRLKDLTPMTLNRENEKKDGGRCVCAVSGKAITTQPVILIKKTGVVLLKDVYQSLLLEDNRSDNNCEYNGKSKSITKAKKQTSLICPVTGKKFKVEKNVLELQKGTSGFAASGEVIAKKYRPTLT